MKTEDLIASLAADRQPSRRPLVWKLAVFAAAAAAVVAAFIATLGFRSDLGTAMTTWQFPAKIAMIISVLAAAAVAATRSIDPVEQRLTRGASLWTAVTVVAIALGLELTSYPLSTLLTRAIGDNALVCLISIPLLAALPLAAVLWIMRDGAPRSPTLAGAAGGVAAGALAATLYANHCTNDSPLYVALWYAAGIVIVTAIGALAGRRWLAW